MQEITATEAIAASTSGGGFLLDVREPDEWAAGHAEQATSIPMSQLAERLGEVPTDSRLLVVCRSGARSAKVTEALIGAGFDAVNVAGGMHAWVASGGDLVSPTDDPPRVA